MPQRENVFNESQRRYAWLFQLSPEPVSGLVAGVSIWLTADVDRVEMSAGGFEVCAVAADFDACKETARSVLVKWEIEVLCGWPPAVCVVL